MYVRQRASALIFQQESRYVPSVAKGCAPMCEEQLSQVEQSGIELSYQ